jgi:hypothetical protein
VDVEILRCPDFSDRGLKMIDALIAAAPEWATVRVNTTWRREGEWLMTYGLGHLQRRHWTEAHQKAGGHVIGWDMGYWDRSKAVDACMRVTIDADHPHAMIVPEPGDRFAASRIQLREDYNEAGPIILCGLGSKQRRWKGLGRWEWENRTLGRLRKRWPDRRIVYRPKKPEDAPGDLKTVSGDIEDVLRGASLVVCHHSNVAVDACIAGVPVQCEDGAAFALYSKGAQPSREERLAFLESLAWWQWKSAEAAMAWEFIRRKLACIGGR